MRIMDYGSEFCVMLSKYICDSPHSLEIDQCPKQNRSGKSGRLWNFAYEQILRGITHPLPSWDGDHIHRSGMRRTGWLMPQIASHSNLAIALHKATLSARKTNEVTLFHAETDQNLSALVNELMSLEWRPIPYYRLMVYDPKQRVIHAAPFRDRVVHHALMNVAGHPC